MTTFSRYLAGLAFFCTLSVSAINCEINENTYRDSCAPSRDEHCGSMCDRLLGCRSITTEQLDACASACEQRIDSREAQDGASCVIEDACRSLSAYADRCPAAPLPAGGGAHVDPPPDGAGSGGGSPSEGAGGSTSSGAGGAPEACRDNHDCAANEDCIQGACLARCDASCECGQGESCVDRYCHSDAPPPPSCASNCDCPQGMTCTDSVCR